MSKYFFFIFITLYNLVKNQQCIFGQNCPYNQGFCIDTKCECIDGYWSLMNKDLPPESQIFCNYQQTNLYLPLFLEFFSPSLGHFYVGKFWFGVVKLILVLSSVLSEFYLTRKCHVPNFIKILKNKLFDEGSLLEKKEGNEIFRGNNPNMARKEELEEIEEKIPLKQKIISYINTLTFYPFWFVWVADIYFYYFKIYKDGNGVPFV